MEETSIRLDDGDHKNQCMDAEKSTGKLITRIISRERVARMMSFEGRTVAIYAPSGLGNECADATAGSDYQHIRIAHLNLHLSSREKRITRTCHRFIKSFNVYCTVSTIDSGRYMSGRSAPVTTPPSP